jgi:hypothetical protein
VSDCDTLVSEERVEVGDTFVILVVRIAIFSYIWEIFWEHFEEGDVKLEVLVEVLEDKLEFLFRVFKVVLEQTVEIYVLGSSDKLSDFDAGLQTLEFGLGDLFQTLCALIF